MKEKFNVFAFEKYRISKSIPSIICNGIKETMLIKRIEYYPEKYVSGNYDKEDCVIVVAVSEHNLFSPKVYDGNGRLIYEDGSSFVPEYAYCDGEIDKAAEMLELERTGLCESFCLNYEMMQRLKNINTTMFDLYFSLSDVEEDEEYDYTDSTPWFEDGINSIVKICDNVSIDPKCLYSYIRKEISYEESNLYQKINCYKQSTNNDMPELEWKTIGKLETYYKILNYLKDVTIYNVNDAGVNVKKNSKECHQFNQNNELYENEPDCIVNANYDSVYNKQDVKTMRAEDGVIYEAVPPTVHYSDNIVKSC